MQASLQFPAVLERLSLHAFDFRKIIQPFMRHEPGLPREMKRHLLSLDEKILEQVAWARGNSSLYTAMVLACGPSPAISPLQHQTSGLHPTSLVTLTLQPQWLYLTTRSLSSQLIPRSKPPGSLEAGLTVQQPPGASPQLCVIYPLACSSHNPSLPLNRYGPCMRALTFQQPLAASDLRFALSTPLHAHLTTIPCATPLWSLGAGRTFQPPLGVSHLRFALFHPTHSYLTTHSSLYTSMVLGCEPSPSSSPSHHQTSGLYPAAARLQLGGKPGP